MTALSNAQKASQLSRRPRGVLAMSQTVRADVFSTTELVDRLTRLVDVDPDLVVDDFSGADLSEVEVLITGWGCPPIEESVLVRAPNLRAVVHTAGTVKEIVSAACWERGITVTSATEANAMPVAEYTLAAILFAQKRVLEMAQTYRELRSPVHWTAEFPDAGNYQRTIGIVGASRIGRRVLELLAPFDFEVLVSDPYVTEPEARALGARLVDLDELLDLSDTVSLHAPSLPETHHMVDRRRLRRLRDGATLINTARGSLIDTDALVDELSSGRVFAVLDVTEPEVLPPSSPLYDLPNVLLTPHIAGSIGRELERLATRALDELQRYANGAPFAYPVLPDQLSRSA